VNEQEKSNLNDLIQMLQRMTSGNVAHIRSNCIGLIKDMLFLSGKEPESFLPEPPPEINDFKEINDLRRMFYFGCKNQAGHGMHCSPSNQVNIDIAHNFLYDNPWRQGIDGDLCPEDKEQKEGIAVISQKDGYTALSFWDRSIDHRFSSNSNFIAEGNFNFEDMKHFAKKFFPEIMNRFKISNSRIQNYKNT
jgi:hypothetical protein